MRLTSRRRGLSLVEMMVAITILLGIIYVSSQLMATLHVGTQTVGKNLDINEDARRALAMMGADLRGSGWGWDNSGSTNRERGPADSGNPVQGTSSFTSTPTLPSLAFRMRTDFVNDQEASWQRWVTWSVVADGNFTGMPGNPARYALQRRERFDTNGDGAIGIGEPDDTVVVLRNVSFARFQKILVNNSDLVLNPAGNPHTEGVDIQLELSRVNPDWSSGAATPEPLRWRYRERVRMQNRPERR